MRDDFNENLNDSNYSFNTLNDSSILNNSSILNESSFTSKVIKNYFKNFLKKLTPYLGMRWAEEIDNRILLFKTENEKRKKLVIDFSEDMEDYETDFEIKADEVVFYRRKN